MLTRSGNSYAKGKKSANSSQKNSQEEKKIKINNTDTLIRSIKAEMKLNIKKNDNEETKQIVPLNLATPSPWPFFASQSSNPANPGSPPNAPNGEEAPESFPITIGFERGTGHAFNLLVNPTNTIAQVKSEIERMELLPVNRQRLKLSGRRLLNNETISSANVKRGSMLMLSWVANSQAPRSENENSLIHIKPMEGRPFDIYVDLAETIKSLKLKILDTKGILPREQRLILNQQEMYEADRSLEDYGVRNQSKINLMQMLRGC